MAQEFIYPEFLLGTSAEEIQQRMMNSLPEDIDGMPGGFAYDFTMPTALEKSEIINLHLVRTLMLMFPQWAWGEWLDLHGRQKGVIRKAATPAQGYVTVTGVTGTRIPAGFIVCTAATDEASSILYTLDEELILPEERTATVPVTAVETGKSSNVKAGMVVIMAQPITGIESITNEADITGGTEEEEDEPYRERVLEAYASEGVSYIGNDSDLIRWAKEVPGIGDCIVSAAWNGPGTIKLSLIDANGEPANDALCEAVYNHIISPGDRSQRLLQAGSGTLTCTPAATVPMSYVCAGIAYNETTDLRTIQTDFEAALKTYYAAAKRDGEIRYVKVHALLADLPGVEDFSDPTINGGRANLTLQADEYPATVRVTLEE